MAYAADLCGSKLRAKLSSTLNEASAQPIPSSSFAAKQMAKMGWVEGTGLGKKRDGIVSHVKVKKREENIGLGVEKERTRQLGVEGMWWSTSVAGTLMKLQQQKSNDEKSKKKKKSGSSSKEEKKSKKRKKDKKETKTANAGKIYTEEELFVATGGARFGTKGGKRSEGKWHRSEHSKKIKEWEKEVKGKAEWNGLGKANILLTDNSSNSKKKRKRSSEDETTTLFCEEKKEDDTPNINVVSTEESSVEESNNVECKKKEKKGAFIDSKETRSKEKRKKSKSDKKSKKKKEKR